MKNMYQKILFTIIAALMVASLLLTGCTGKEEDENTPKPTIPTIEHVAFDTYNQFAIELLKHTRKTGKNQIISPISIGVALSMIHMGAGPDTAIGLEEALNLRFTDINRTTNSCHAVIERLSGFDPSWFSSHTALYIGEGPSIKESMAERMENYFDLMISFYDFGDEKAILEMNDWVDKSSSGRIDPIFSTESLSVDMAAMLVNVSTMDCKWQTGFIKDNTRSIPFETDDGKGVAAPTMRGKINMKLYEGEDALAGFIPLAEDATTMAILIPPVDIKLDEFLDTLEAQSILMWQSIAYEGEQWALLPKLNMFENNSLKESLSEMGAQDVFIDESADFTPMGVNFYLDDVMQAVQVRADEDGENVIEVSSIDLTRAINNKEYFFTATRPFIYAIIDDETGGLLMIGALANPIDD